ncbi:substrate-binding periplasmic protein [Rhodoferax aquaticus]|uniref:ABC transporter substrate-binding protein n=1 Tax=Rhodoferax aquaticus TaxID=2527691 RepID=A0A515EQW9_9BURK|nr:ABC transporter substrate-binding protein [Rhodoferax aquaticus]QDL55058.1 ABC transporter substrate-binding protein [Rhodoferax aquaticus]
MRIVGEFKRWVCCIATWACASACTAQVVFPLPADKDRARFDFEFTVLQQALSVDHKQASGPLPLASTVVWSEHGMNLDRALLELAAGRISIVPRFATPTLAQSFTEVDFAIDKGLQSKRVLLTRKDVLPKLAGVRDAIELKPLRFGVLVGWRDKQLLQDAGYSVEATNAFDGLFQMLAKGRTDAILVGALHHAQITPLMSKYKGLVTEPSLFIEVPTEQRFYTALTTEGAALARQVQAGLQSLQRSGEFDKIHLHYFGQPERLLQGRRRVTLTPHN